MSGKAHEREPLALDLLQNAPEHSLLQHIASLEEERGEYMQSSNALIVSLKEDNARVRAALERSEAIRHQLDSDLALARRNLNDKQTTWELEAAVMAKRIVTLAQQFELQKQEAGIAQARDEQERNALVADNTVLRQRLSTLENELKAFYDLRSSQSAFIADAQARETSHNDTIAQQALRLSGLERELQRLQECDRASLSALQSVTKKLQEAEQIILAERKKNVDAAFALEVSQMKLASVSTTLESEKNLTRQAQDALVEARHLHASMEHQVRQEQSQNSSLNKLTQDYKTRLETLARETSSFHHQLGEELDAKTRIISELSASLHQTQQELELQRDKLIMEKTKHDSLELMFSASLNELLLQLNSLLQLCKGDLESLRPVAALQPPQGHLREEGDLKHIFASVKTIVSQCHISLRSAFDDMAKAQAEAERLLQEHAAYLMLLERQGATIQEVQQEAQRKDVDILGLHERLQATEREQRHLLELYEQHKRENESESSSFKVILQERDRTLEAYERQLQLQDGFLATLYEQLLQVGLGSIDSGEPHQPARPGAGVRRATSWSEMASLINAEVARVLAVAKARETQLKQASAQQREADLKYQRISVQQDTAIEELQSRQRHAETDWQDQRQQLEQLQQRTEQQLMARAVKAEAHVEELGARIQALQLQLETATNQVAALRTEHASSQKAVQTLQPALQMLAKESEWRILDLILQKAFLKSEVERLQFEAREIDALVESTGGSARQRQPPVSRFRAAGLAVIAMKRFSRHSPASTREFTDFNETSLHRLANCLQQHPVGPQFLPRVFDCVNQRRVQYATPFTHAKRRRTGSSDVRAIPASSTLRSYLRDLLTHLHASETERRTALGNLERLNRNYSEAAQALVNLQQAKDASDRSQQQLRSQYSELRSSHDVLKGASVEAQELRQQYQAQGDANRELLSRVTLLETNEARVQAFMEEFTTLRTHALQADQQIRTLKQQMTQYDEEKFELLRKLQTIQQCLRVSECEKQQLMAFLLSLDRGMAAGAMEITARLASVAQSHSEQHGEGPLLDEQPLSRLAKADTGVAQSSRFHPLQLERSVEDATNDWRTLESVVTVSHSRQHTLASSQALGQRMQAFLA
eukprot:m.628318 g.628318  ORF g.628318 m.628318 type:complete len:1115 (-) comp58259_c0_seq3:2105-5449(-)